MALRPLALAGITASLSLCATPQKSSFQLGLLGTSLEMSVVRVIPRGPYLEVWLHAPGLDLVSYAPADASCPRVLAEAQQIAYRSGGTGGSFERAGARCDAAGIGSLVEWRDRRPRPGGRSPVPSAPARYRVVYRDEEVALARGRFPLAGLVGWVGGADTVAAIPNTAACQEPLASGEASMLYYPAGREVLALASERGPCPIVGLLAPRPG
jgi:hypothetical protein